MNPSWALFISGRGSNAQAVCDEFLPQIKLVVSSQPAVWGLSRAKRMSLPRLILPKTIDWKSLDHTLGQRGISHIFLLGFMRLVPVEFVQKWQGRIYNLHPSLLPDFPGLHAIERSFDSKDSDMGVTVHEVTAEMDAGRRLYQAQSLSFLDKRKGDLHRAQLLISRDEQRLVRKLMAKVSGERK